LGGFFFLERIFNIFIIQVNLKTTPMTPRSFWTILIKILGIYIILESLTSIPQLLTFVWGLMAQRAQSDSLNIYLIEIAYFILEIAVFATVLYYCLFKTDWIIDKLKLDQGFQDERFELTMHRSTILKIAIMVIGGLLLIDSFPFLCKNLLECLQMTTVYGGYAKNPNLFYVALYLIKSFIGYFLLTCSRMIVNFIELKRKKPAENHIED
jgi:hypothetical protein